MASSKRKCTYLFVRFVERIWRDAETELAGAWTRAGFDWRSDREAVRHGFFAAFQWAAQSEWTIELEALLEREWMNQPRDQEWSDVGVLARHGWNEGRRRITAYPHATTAENDEAMAGLGA